MFDIKLVFTFLLLTDVAGLFDEAEVELSVFEGENLTVFTRIARSEEDPQVMLSRLNGTAEDLIAQLTCHNQICTNECMDPAVLIQYDKQNLSVVFVNARRGQTGLYKVCVFSKTPSENRIYKCNITVIEPPLRTISSEAPPSSEMSKSVTAGISSAGAMVVLVIIIVVIIIIVRKKSFFTKVPSDVP